MFPATASATCLRILSCASAKMRVLMQEALRERASLGVGQSQCLVFLQTRESLMSSSVLIELFCAIELGIPVVPVLLRGGGFDFEGCAAVLSDLQGHMPPLRLVAPGWATRGRTARFLRPPLLSVKKPKTGDERRLGRRARGRRVPALSLRGAHEAAARRRVARL